MNNKGMVKYDHHIVNQTKSLARQIFLLTFLSLFSCILALVAVPAFADDTDTQTAINLLKWSQEFIQQGDYDTALSILKKVIEKGPALSIIHTDYGLALKYVGQTDLAKKEFLNAIKLDRNDNRAWLNLWLVYDAEGDQANADKAFAEYLRLAINIPESEKSKAHLRADDLFGKTTQFIREKNYTAAAQQLQTICTMDATWAPYRAYYCFVLSKLGRYEEANKQCLQAILLDHRYADAWHDMGISNATLGQPITALNALKMYINMAPSGSEVMHDKELIKIFEQANPQVDPNISQAISLRMKAWDLFQTQNDNAALNTMEKAVALEPSCALFQSEYGWFISHISGNNDEAMTHLLKAAQLDNTLVSNYLCLGFINAETGNTSSASVALTKYLDATGDSKTTGAGILLDDLNKSPESSDYFVPNGALIKCWNQIKMPLKVCVDDGKGIAGFNSSYKNIVEQSFKEWSNILPERLSFDFTNKKSDADIVVKWSNDLDSISRPTDLGITKSFNDREGLTNVLITMLTTIPPPTTEARLKRIAMHEIGHALGIHFHSSNPADIMYFSAAYSGTASRLSQRDINTLRRLYTAN